MVRLDWAAVLLAGAAVVKAVTPHAPSFVPGAYIVEYEEDQDSSSFVNTLGGTATIRKDLNFKLFKGVSIQFKNTNNAAAMAAKVATMPKVKAVYPVRRYPVPHHVVHSKGTVLDEGLVKRQVAGNDSFSTHLMTQVNKFRNAGITGKGVKIAVIDTGIDYLHEALGGCFGPGCLVSYGADLVGDDFDGSNTPVPDDDPMDCQGHGTHVAGIVAAQTSNPFGIVGAATDVTLGAYRVFGCTGDTPNDVLIEAYKKAYEAGSDIITASIGGPSGWSEDPWAAVVTRIVENGVPCVVSAGNDGSAGIFYASTAANGKKVTAIASIDNIVTPVLLTNASYTIDGTDSTFGFTAGDPGAWGDVSLPLWTGNFDTANPADGCEPYPDSTPDLSDYIVLIRRGTCTFVEKATNAAAKGAKYIMFYNNEPHGTVSVAAGEAKGIEAVAMVTADQGEEWVSALEGGSEVVLHLTDPLVAGSFLISTPNTVTGGFMSDYTSWGPTWEVDVKPQFGTPGGSILSTYPRALGSYAVLSGTSMACPLAAGIYALLINTLKTKDPKTLENRLSSTARPNLFRLDGESLPLLAPVAQQGAGIIQAWDAAHATTLLSVSSLSFNDTDHFKNVQTFTVTNAGDKTVEYSLSNVGAATAYTFKDAQSIRPAPFPNELTDDYASLAGVDTKRLPVYSGYIAINGSDSSALSLPYLGVAGSLHSAPVLGPEDAWLSVDNHIIPAPVPPNSTFVLPPPGFANDTSYNNRTDLPMLVVDLALGSAVVRADIVPLSEASATNTRTVFGTPTVGQPYGFPVRYNPRGLLQYEWDGRLDDGSYAPAGPYRFVVRALRLLGDEKRASEYDVVETVDFNIKYLPSPSSSARFRRRRSSSSSSSRMF
ncbi:hypothetical protein VTH82DRAFT_7072 [Thermothelomyces myriococcoides]